MSQPVSLHDRIAVLGAALPALRRIAEVQHEAAGSQLGDMVTFFDTIVSEAARARDAAVAEAVRRGEVDGILGGWIRTHAPSLRQGGAPALARLVTDATKGGPLCSGEGAGLDPDSPVGIVWNAVTVAEEQEATEPASESADETEEPEETAAHGAASGPTPPLSPANAMAVLHEVKHLEPRLRPEVVPTVTRILVDLALEWGAAHMRKFRPRLIAEYGRDGELDDLQERLAKSAFLSQPEVESGGLTQYRMAMTPAQAAAFEAAIGPLSAPAPNRETGERDLRPAGQRRLEALIEVCQRALSDQLDDSGRNAGGATAVVHVNLNLDDLRAMTGTADAATTWGSEGSTWSVWPGESAGGTGSDETSRDETLRDEAFRDLLTGEVLASTATGTLLSPTTLRLLACGAHLIPHVLGSDGEHLDQGREIRLFDAGQRRKLLRRDKGCTYPGCDRPGSWCRAHHVLHWLDDGPSDIDNAAMLCERHHTVVHRRRLWAEVRTTPDDHGRYVVWDLTDHSYDRELARRAAERAMHDPPPLTAELIRQLTVAAASSDRDEQAWADDIGRGHFDDALTEAELIAWRERPSWDEATQSFVDPPTAA